MDLEWTEYNVDHDAGNNPFDFERKRLIEEITKGLQRMAKNMNKLNSQIENLLQGQEGIDQAVSVWQQHYAQASGDSLDHDPT